jgi:hypothetical protein
MKIIFAAFVLATAVAAPVHAEALTSKDLNKLFPGSYTVKIFNKWDLRVRMSSNGAIKGTAAGFSDTGRWSIEGGKLCIAWNSWTNGRKGCSALRRENGVIKGRGFVFKV